MTQDAGDGVIGCTRGRSPTTISDHTVDSAAFVKFEVPDVPRWSIGFAYHRSLFVETDTATYIWSDGPNRVFASHWVREEGEYLHDLHTGLLSGSLLRSGKNQLAFRTSSDGTFLRLNDETVIEVLESQLSRHVGWSGLCVGFLAEEDESYSITYTDLRTRFRREAGSGSLTHSNPVSEDIACATNTSDHAFFGSALDSWVVLDFVVPDVEKWSIGIIYHRSRGAHSRMIVASSGESHRVSHSHYDDRGPFDMITEIIPNSLINSRSGDKNRFEFETTRGGSSLFLNGRKVMEVPGDQLRRKLGSTNLCVHVAPDETESYEMQFSDLWAWGRLED